MLRVCRCALSVMALLSLYAKTLLHYILTKREYLFGDLVSTGIKY
jgi:hypothetical protein